MFVGFVRDMDPFKAACHIQRIYRGRLVRRDYFWDTIRKNYHDAFDTIISVKLKAGDPHEHNHLHYDEDGVECFEWYYCDCCEKDILEKNVYSNREEDFDLCTPCYALLVSRTGPDSPNYPDKFEVPPPPWVSNRV